MDTKELYFIQGIKDGNSDIYKEVYRLYYEPLCHFASNYFDDSTEAEDIVQETLLQIWENRKKAKIVQLKSYLFSSVKHACLNRIKHLKIVQKHKDATLYDIRILELENNESYLEELKEKEALVEKMLSSLPEQRQKIMRLRYIDNLSSGEIAEQEQLSKRTVETHIYKSVKKLTELFAGKSTLLAFIISNFLVQLYVNFQI